MTVPSPPSTSTSTTTHGHEESKKRWGGKSRATTTSPPPPPLLNDATRSGFSSNADGGGGTSSKSIEAMAGTLFRGLQSEATMSTSTMTDLSGHASSSSSISHSDRFGMRSSRSLPRSFATGRSVGGSGGGSGHTATGIRRKREVAKRVTDDEEQWKKFQEALRNRDVRTGMKLKQHMHELLRERWEEIEDADARSTASRRQGNRPLPSRGNISSVSIINRLTAMGLGGATLAAERRHSIPKSATALASVPSQTSCDAGSAAGGSDPQSPSPTKDGKLNNSIRFIDWGSSTILELQKELDFGGGGGGSNGMPPGEEDESFSSLESSMSSISKAGGGHSSKSIPSKSQSGLTIQEADFEFSSDEEDEDV